MIYQKTSFYFSLFRQIFDESTWKKNTKLKSSPEQGINMSSNIIKT